MKGVNTDTPDTSTASHGTRSGVILSGVGGIVGSTTDVVGNGCPRLNDDRQTTDKTSVTHSQDLSYWSRSSTRSGLRLGPSGEERDVQALGDGEPGKQKDSDRGEDQPPPWSPRRIL